MIAEIKAFFPRYPTRQAVTLPALHIVNERLRYVPLQAVVEIASCWNWPRRRCRTRSRSTASSSRTSRTAARGLGLPLDQLCPARRREVAGAHVPSAGIVKPGETTPDGKLTLEYAECLGACEHAPCMLANDAAQVRDERARPRVCEVEVE
jgi:NADH-quinone oxidoreductase subunit E